jgi:hypothetical protein
MTEYYVSNSGNDGNPGTDIEKPFLTINHAVKALNAGDTLFLRHGSYLEQVSIANKKNVVIRSYPGEHACIDGIIRQFSILDYCNWRPALLDDPDAHKEEYISTETFPTTPNNPINRGAFLDVYPYTRLITHMNLNDLRADHETFEQITGDDPREGPKLVVEECGSDPGPECEYTLGDKRYKPAPYRYPWVYMGPGLWFHRQTHKIHIRLSHTHNNVPGIGDYAGETDPNKVRLAISSKLMKALSIRKCENLRLEDLSIRFGGDETMTLANCKNVVFDHVRFLCARTGVNLAGNAVGPVKDTVFQHCEFDGGLPTWYFRTDRKARYFFVEKGKVFENRLGGGTLDLLLFGNPTNTGTEIHHCEFHDAHDVYLFGTGVEFHHNWIHNLNDEGLFLDAGTLVETQHFEMKIYQNVITKTLSAISFAGNDPKGNWYIYRNLIDLRSPTAGHRPRHKNDSDVWRYGHLIKTVGTDGPRDLFQNTCLAYSQRAHAVYRNYENLIGNHPRRTFNNIFVAVYTDSEPDAALAFLPTPDFPGPTDGNDYFRIGNSARPLLKYNSYAHENDCYPGGTFQNLTELYNSEFFDRSQSQYPPGYEARGKEDDPLFRQIGTDGVLRDTDDLRLSNTSTLKNAGVAIPYQELRDMDPFAPVSGNPDIGCYPFGSGPLEVGVDGRKSYPIL